MQLPNLANSRLTIFEKTLGWMDHHLARHSSQSTASHVITGLRGEDAAYFKLRRLGYTIIARRWRSARQRGDIDLIGWDGDWLCFIEVKTRSSKNFQPAEVAVDGEKRKVLTRMAQEYVRHLEHPDQIPVRFDVVSVYFAGCKPEFDIFRGAFDWQ